MRTRLTIWNVSSGEYMGPVFWRNSARAALAISGHTHIATLVREEETIFLNPGSCSLPLGRDPASVAMVFAHEIRILTLSGDLLHLESW